MKRLPRWLPLAIGTGLFALTASLLLLAAGSTLGYDYRCYDGAARALADGKPFYDNAFAIAVGTCPGTYTYPPPFAAALVPWLVLGDAAPAAWCVAMAACFVAGAFILPVRIGVRGGVLVLGALDWPLLYAVKLGQVGPILFLLFALAWRSLRGPSRRAEDAAIGLAAGLGAIVKVQPALLAVWALATRRYRAVAVAVAVALAATLATLPFTGVGAWFTYADLLRGLGGTFDAPHDFAPGAIAHLAGASDPVAAAVQVGSAAIAVAGLVALWRVGASEVSFMATVVVSQMLSAPVRDHYALLLLLPTALLLERGRTWAMAIPLLGWIAVLAFPTNGAASWPAAATISLTFFGCLAALLVEAISERRSAAQAPANVSAMLGR